MGVFENGGCTPQMAFLVVGKSIKFRENPAQVTTYASRFEEQLGSEVGTSPES